MTTAELLAVLTRECPNGVSFDPMAVRLLRQKVPLEETQIEDLKAEMFQLARGLWFPREMILNDELYKSFIVRAFNWYSEHGCFTVERLFDEFCGDLRHIDTPEVCANFLKNFGFNIEEFGKDCFFCFIPLHSLKTCLSSIAQKISSWLEEADGILSFHEIEQAMPHLTAEALEGIRAQFLPEIHFTEVGGVPCWCSMEAIHLPEDFSEKLTTVIDTLVELDQKLTAANLEFALNLFYRIRFREEYALSNIDTFMRVCSKHYQGENNFFPKTKKPISVLGKRMRSPNTRFSNLGVPTGATLVFTKDNQTTCTVQDGNNQVKYDGKVWAVSALAISLLGGSAVNGFAYFSYEGEILSDRRSRLDRDGSINYENDDIVPEGGTNV